MGAPAAPLEKPDYGIDAPPVIRNLLIAAGVAVVVAVAAQLLGTPYPAGFAVRETAAFVALTCCLNAAVMVYYSKVGKLRSRERLLDLVPWRGDETVLDVGCGRGLLLVAAARRLTTGKAVGVDLWQAADLSGNRPEATLENARREGVADRVEVRDGDARKLPFADGSFDTVVSNVALHNIPDAAGREAAVREIARVLRPGGHVLISDIQHTAAYAHTLADCGLTVKRFAAGWVTYLSAAATWGAVRPYRVTAHKPSAA
jgi:ubiquinone/menaquinone biosynthesis C-methylase UbiE